MNVPRETSARETLLLSMTEAQMQRTIIQTAQMHGWRVHHDPPVRLTRADGSVRHITATAADPGFPDLVLARAGEVIIVECKRQVGARWKPGQREWLAALGARVVRPADMDSLLTRLRRPPPVPCAHAVWKRYGGAVVGVGDMRGQAWCARCGIRRVDGVIG